MGRTVVTTQMRLVVNRIDNHLDKTVAVMATDIHRQASILAPHASGALIGSGRITRNGQADYDVTYGGGKVPYAKRRHYENRKNPQTLKYLERAGDNVSRNLKRYIESA